jgi:hypothetical protein
MLSNFFARMPKRTKIIWGTVIILWLGYGVMYLLYKVQS